MNEQQQPTTAAAEGAGASGLGSGARVANPEAEATARLREWMEGFANTVVHVGTQRVARPLELFDVALDRARINERERIRAEAMALPCYRPGCNCEDGPIARSGLRAILDAVAEEHR